MADDIGDSVCKCCSGPLLVIFGICFLAWNEFRFVWQSHALDYAESNARHTGCDCNENLDGSLIFLSCEVTKLPQITNAPALKAIRGLLADKDADQGTDMLVEVEIFQTERHVSRRRHSTVTYTQEWTSHPHDVSCSWIDDDDCENDHGSLPSNLETVQVQASNGSVWIGERRDPNSGYYLKREDIRQVTRVPKRELFVRQADRHREPQEDWDIYQGGKITEHNVFTNGNTLQTYPPDEYPRIGDIRAMFELIKPNVVSIIARQIRSRPSPKPSWPWQAVELTQHHKTSIHGSGLDQGDVSSNVQQYPGGQVEHPECTFEAHENKGGYDIDWLLDGQYTLDGFIDQTRRENSWLLWKYRLVGWAMMALGLSLIVDAGFELLGGGDCVGCISGVFIATPLAMLVISLAWWSARPFMSKFLLACACVTGCAVFKWKRNKGSSGREVDIAIEDVEGEASHYKQVPE